eukprot:g29537.t1
MRGWACAARELGGCACTSGGPARELPAPWPQPPDSPAPWPQPPAPAAAPARTLPQCAEGQRDKRINTARATRTIHGKAVLQGWLQGKAVLQNRCGARAVEQRLKALLEPPARPALRPARAMVRKCSQACQAVEKDEPRQQNGRTETEDLLCLSVEEPRVQEMRLRAQSTGNASHWPLLWRVHVSALVDYAARAAAIGGYHSQLYAWLLSAGAACIRRPRCAQPASPGQDMPCAGQSGRRGGSTRSRGVQRDLNKEAGQPEPAAIDPACVSRQVGGCVS